MNCRQFNDALDTYLDTELAAQARADLEGHAGICPHCAHLLSALRQAEEALRLPEFRPAPPGMLADFHRRLARPRTQPRASFWPWAIGSLATAAAAAALIFTLGPRPGAPGPTRAAQDGLSLAAGGAGSRRASPAEPRDSRTVASLPGGSNVDSFRGAAGPAEAAGTPAATTAGLRAASPEGQPSNLHRDREPAPTARPRAMRIAGAPAAGPNASAPNRARPDVNVSPALVAALNRQVTVSINADPPARAVAKLAEAADVAVQVDAPPIGNRVTYQAQGEPLYAALEQVAAQSGLVITPQGDGLRLAMREPTLLEMEGVVAQAGARGRGAEARAAQNVQQQQQQPSQERGSPAQVPGGYSNALGRAGRLSVWSAQWGDLPTRGFAAPEATLNYGQGAERAPTPARKMAAARKPEPSGGRAGGGGGGFGGGGGGLGGGFDQGGWLRGGASGGPAGAPGSPAFGAGGASGPPTVRNESLGSLPKLTAKSGERPQIRDAAPEDVSKARAATRAQTESPVALAAGRVLLVRSRDGERYAALSFAAADPKSGGALRFRLWLQAGDGSFSPAEAALADGVNLLAGETKSGRSAPVLDGVLEWTPGRAGTVMVRVRAGGLSLCPTNVRETRGLDPRDSRWTYR